LSVHIAARVMEAAGDGGIVVSRTVADRVAGSELRLVDEGERPLKGVPGVWRLFRVDD
jgi:class 3 adenylate cyclase